MKTKPKRARHKYPIYDLVRREYDKYLILCNLARSSPYARRYLIKPLLMQLEKLVKIASQTHRNATDEQLVVKTFCDYLLLPLHHFHQLFSEAFTETFPTTG